MLMVQQLQGSVGDTFTTGQGELLRFFSDTEVSNQRRHRSLSEKSRLGQHLGRCSVFVAAAGRRGSALSSHEVHSPHDACKLTVRWPDPETTSLSIQVVCKQACSAMGAPNARNRVMLNRV